MLAALDRGLLRAMRTWGHAGPLEGVVRRLTRLGEWGAVWTGAALAAAAADAERRERWLRAAAIPVAAIGANYAVKLVVGRRRPELDGLPPLAGAPSKLSFPSAHATSSFAAATALGRIAPEARPGLYAGAAAMALSRPYLGMHYPSDVLGGAALGLVLGQLAPGLENGAGPTPPRRP